VVRLIATKVAVQGESEYQTSIKNINASLRTLKSEMSLVEAQTQKDAKSKEALAAKTTVLVKIIEQQRNKVSELQKAVINARAAETEYATSITNTKEKIEQAEKKLEKMKQTAGDSAERQKVLTEEIAKQRDELANLEAYQDSARAGAEKWQRQLNSAEKEVANLTNRLEEMAQLRLDGIQERIDKIAGSLNNAANKIMPFSAAAAAGMAAATKAAIDFEDAMAGVDKTTDLTAGELALIKEEIRALALDIPVAAKELAGITEAAGQLGIRKENLIGFTQTMADLGVATDMAGESAATTAAQFANITQMNQGNVDRWGSTIVSLGNNMATTESKIADMALRLAAAASQAGMAESEILAIAGTFSSLGMEAQAGGSAVSRIMTDITLAVETGSDELDNYAQVAGMSAKAFADAWKTDAAGALVTFVEGLSDVERTGKSATLILAEMEITEQRTSDALRRAAGAGDLFRDALDMAGTAWEENSALAEEAAKKYETTASQIQLLKNEATDLAIEFGDMLLPSLRELIKTGGDALTWFRELDDATQKNILRVVAFTAAVGPLLKMTATATTTVGAVVKGVVALTGATAAQKVATDAATASQTGLNIAMNANPAVAVITAIGALVAVVGALAVANSLTGDSQKRLNAEIDETIAKSREASEAIKTGAAAKMDELSAVENLLPRLEELNEKGFARTTAEQQELNDIIRQTNEAYPGLIGQIDDATAKYGLNTESILANVEAMKIRQQIEANEATIAENKRLLLELESREIEVVESLNDAKARLHATNLDELMMNEEETAAYYASAEAAAEVHTGMRALTEEKERLNQEILALTSNTNGLAAEFEEMKFRVAQSGEQTVENIQTQISYYESLRRTALSAYLDIANAASAAAGKGATRTAAQTEKQVVAYDAEIARLTTALSTSVASEPVRSGFTAASEGSKGAGKSKTEETKDTRYRDELASLDYMHSMGEVSTADYYDKLSVLRDEYLEKNSAEWRSANLKLYNYQKDEYNRQTAALKDSYNLGKMTSEEYLTAMKDMQREYLEEGSDEWLKAGKELNSQQEKIYDEKLGLQKYFLDMGIITEKEYYAQLENLRDTYLAENSAKWQAANVQLLNQQKAALQQLTAEQEKKQKSAADKIESMRKGRIASIEREIAAEEKRVATVVEGINDEIAARRRLRQEQADGDAVARARKALEAAQGQLEFARDDYTRAELEKEVARAQAAYDAAVQNKADNDFVAQKQAEIKALEEQLEAAKVQAQVDIDNAGVWAQREYAKEQRQINEILANREAQAAAKEASEAAAGAVKKVVETIVQTVNNVSNVNSKSATLNITNNSSGLTSGQLANTVEKLLK